MVDKKSWLGILVVVLVLGMTVVSCDLPEEEDFTGTINGTWHLLEAYSNNKTGTIITISNNVGVLAAIGEDDVFGLYSDSLSVGDTILRNIKYKGAWKDSKNTVYWDCDFYFPFSLNYTYYRPDLAWNDTYISYDRNESRMFVFTNGDPDFGFGFDFKK